MTLIVGLTISSGSGSNSAIESNSDQPRASRPLVEFTGCSAVEAGPSCRLASQSAVGLWLGHSDLDQIQLSVNDRLIDLESRAKPAHGGWQISLQPDELPGTLVVSSAETGADFSLQLESSAHEHSIESALATFTVDDQPSSLQRIDVALAAPSSTAAESLRGYLLRRRAGVLIRLGRWPEALQSLRESAQAHRRHGQLSAAIEQTTSLVYFLIHRYNDYAGAAQALALAPTPVTGDADRAIKLARSRGDLSLALGDMTTAQEQFSQSLQAAERVNHSAGITVARVGLARSWAEAGYFGHASDVLAALDDHSLAAISSCDRARALNTQSWHALLEYEAYGLIPGAQVEARLNEAARLLEQDCLHLDTDRSNVAVNQALNALARGRLAESEARLQEAERITATPPPLQRAWIEDIRARIALARNQFPVALDIYLALNDWAQLAGLIDIEWRAAVGLAEAHLAMQQSQPALLALQHADRLLRDFVSRLPTSQSRALYLARFESVPKLLTTLLVQENRIDEALQLAQRYRIEPLLREQQAARTTALTTQNDTHWQSLVSRYQKLRRDHEDKASEAWAVPQSELAKYQADQIERQAALRQIAEQAARLTGIASDMIGKRAQASADELNLLYFPGRDGWIGFAYNDQHLQHAILPFSSAQLVAQPTQLLRPFSKLIEGSARLRILSYGALRQIDFHQIRWHEQPLLSAKRISYGVDVSLTQSPTQRAITDILLVGDPSGDLPLARQELSQITSVLRRAGATNITTLVGRQANLRALRDALSQSDLFHYAGHAVSSSAKDSLMGFPLSGGQRFNLADVLMLDRVPNTAVLAGCETGRVELGIASESLSLAHAFVLRGSREVIATTRPVADTDATRLVAALYQHRQNGQSIGDALVAAQRELIASQPATDWAAFRLYVL